MHSGIFTITNNQELNKIKVLFALPNLTTAGSGREMLNIAERLDKNLFEAWIGVQQVGGELFDEIIARKMPVVVQPFIVDEQASLATKIRKARAYARDFRSLEFDIWQSFNWSSDFSEALVARWAGAKYLYVKKNMNWGRKAWKTKTMFSTAVVARNSTMLETFFASKRYKRKVHLIPGGVETDKFKPGYDMTARQEFGIPDKALMVSCIAQLVRSKDHATLIKAAAKVEQAYVVIAGAVRDNEYKAELYALIKKLGVQDRVKIAGHYSNVNSLLNASNAFVLPTSSYMGHEEGCPVSILEAMAAGTPCIVSDVAGNRDLIEHGKTGLVFKPEKADALADCLREFINKPSYPKELAEKALDKVYGEYTIQKEVQKFEALYSKLMKRR